MENKIMDIIFDSIKDKNLYNYDNDKRLENCKITKFENILGNNVIGIKTKDKEYIVSCACVYSDYVETRKCSECSKNMNEGYCIDNGLEYYCSDECLHKHYTDEEYKEMYDDGNGDSYWTEWED